MGSRKFQVLILAVALMGVILVVAGVLAGMGKATFDQFLDTAKWAVGAVGGVSAVLIGAIAHEDAAQKSNGPVNAAGDVTINNPPPGGSMPPTGGGTTFRDAPPPPPVATGFGSFAPVSRKVKLAAGTLMVMTLAALPACTGIFKQDAKTALDVEQAACVLANIALDVPALRTVCRISDALDPELEKLLAAGRKVAATKGAPVCRDAGAP